MSDFDVAVVFTLKHEGNVDGSPHNDPNDPGGNTRWGLAQRYHKAINVMELNRDQAIAIYKDLYWDKYSCNNLPYPMNCLHFETCVNPGPAHAITILGLAANPQDYLLRRIQWYMDAARDNSNKLPYLRGWISRSMDFYRQFLD